MLASCPRGRAYAVFPDTRDRREETIYVVATEGAPSRHFRSRFFKKSHFGILAFPYSEFDADHKNGLSLLVLAL